MGLDGRSYFDFNPIILFKMSECKYCHREIQDDAVVCKHCGSDLVPRKNRLLRKRRAQKRSLWIALGLFVLISSGAIIFDDQLSTMNLKTVVSDIFTKKDKGKLVGISFNMELSDMVSGRVDSEDMSYAGTITLEKANGEKIEALCEPSFAKTLEGGQLIEVVFDKELDSWKATKILKE